MLRITEATYEGPDSDGDFRFEIELELKNTEENAEISGVRIKTKPKVEQTVGGKKVEKQGRGLNEVIILIIVLIVVSKLL